MEAIKQVHLIAFNKNETSKVHTIKAPPFELKITPPREQENLLPVAFHEWRCADESVWCSFHRIDNSYLLRFPDNADFRINPKSIEIQCFPVPGTTNATINQLYLNQVLPLVQSLTGESVFHAGAIVVNDLAIAFVGVSGRGKSTLTASFSSNFHEFLTDDGLQIMPTENGYRAFPSHPSIRLWEDSQAAILGPTVEAEEPLEYTDKLRFPAGSQMPHRAVPCPLHRMYFLGDASVLQIKFSKLSPQEAMVELIKHSFILDVENREIMAKHFDAISKLCTQGIFYRLDYPRSYDQLANLRQSILEHAGLANKKSASSA